MRQTLYMVDVYYSIVDRTETVEMDEKRWNSIAKLLDEIEITYFVTVAFPNDGDLFHDERDKRVEVSLSTFIDYFSNALIIYEEQTLDRIVRYFKPYDNQIKSWYGFTVDEADKLDEEMIRYVGTNGRVVINQEELQQCEAERNMIEPYLRYNTRTEQIIIMPYKA